MPYRDLNDDDIIQVGDETNIFSKRRNIVVSPNWSEVEKDWKEIGWTVKDYREKAYDDIDHPDRIFRRKVSIFTDDEKGYLLSCIKLSITAAEATEGREGGREFPSTKKMNQATADLVFFKNLQEKIEAT